jgi:hypothetical protein
VPPRAGTSLAGSGDVPPEPQADAVGRHRRKILQDLGLVALEEESLPGPPEFRQLRLVGVDDDGPPQAVDNGASSLGKAFQGAFDGRHGRNGHRLGDNGRMARRPPLFGDEGRHGGRIEKGRIGRGQVPGDDDKGSPLAAGELGRIGQSLEGPEKAPPHVFHVGTSLPQVGIGKPLEKSPDLGRLGDDGVGGVFPFGNGLPKGIDEHGIAEHQTMSPEKSRLVRTETLRCLLFEADQSRLGDIQGPFEALQLGGASRVGDLPPLLLEGHGGKKDDGSDADSRRQGNAMEELGHLSHLSFNG